MKDILPYGKQLAGWWLDCDCPPPCCAELRADVINKMHPVALNQRKGGDE